MLAIGLAGVEIRTLINGKLLHTLPVPGVQLGTSRDELYVLCGGKGNVHGIYKVQQS